ncbi:MAG: DUF6049 family protein [Naasia sp.]
MQLRTGIPRAPGSSAVLRSRLVAAVSAIALVLGPAAIAAGAPAAATSAVAAEDHAATISFAPEDSGLSRPGQPLVVSGSVVNSGDTPLNAGSVTISVAPETVDEQGLQDGWADPATVRTVDLVTIETPPLTVAGSVQLSAVIPPEVVDGALAGTGWGAHVVLAEFTDGELAASNTSALVRLDGEAPAPLTVSVVLPLTAAPSIDGLLDVEQLERLTGPAGLLTRRLAAVTDSQIALALDPRIVASIRVLGSRAPESATAWLAQLEALPNEIFPLQYADADPALQISAGTAQPLAPFSFAAALDPADFVDDPSTPSPAPTTPSPTEGSPTPGGTATPAPEEEAAQVPAVEEILSFPYTRSDLAWPAAGASTAQSLDAAAAAGLGSSIVSAGQLDSATGSTAELDGRRVLVADSLSAAASATVYSVGTTSGRVTASRAAGLLAAATSRPETNRTLLLALDRGQDSGTDVADRLAAILALPWIGETALSSAEAAAPTPAALLPPADDRIASAASLLEDEAAIGAFSSVLAQPELLTSSARLDLLATLSAGWAEDPSGWAVAVSEQRARTAGILGSVTIDESSQVNQLAPTAGLPVYVTNTLPYPITVVVTPRASNGRMTITGTTVTVDPQSTGRTQLEAKAIANGRVSVELSLSSPIGTPIGVSRTFQLELSPFVETLGIAGLAVLVLGLLGFGTFRSIRRGRRARETPETVEGDLPVDGA